MPDTPSVTTQPSDELFLTETASLQAPRTNRPPVHAKPAALQARPRSREDGQRPLVGDELLERFSQIRVQRKPAPMKIVRDARDLQSGSVEMPSPAEYTPSSSEDSSSIVYPSQSITPGTPPNKPSGPRAMHPPVNLPPPPPKIPLDSSAEVQLPKAPAPAYDPSKSNVSTLKTGSTSATREQDSRNSQISMNRQSRHSQWTDEYPRTGQPNERDALPSPRKSLPLDTRAPKSISAAELFERLRECSVLLVDVRSRDEFDQGHIHATSIMCIEPIGLKPGLSADELEDRLIISPDKEQSHFERRNEFDMVVYYDQTTLSERFLTGAPSGTGADALRALHDTLYEFNDYKPLRRPPLLLKGGLDAWIDLVGPQALTTSRTAAVVGSTRARMPVQKAGRPIGRVPMASANSSLEVRKRRLRDQKPLTPDEERSWSEKVHNEEIDPADYQNTQSDGETDSNAEEPPSPFVHTYEDFLRRFPEAPNVQQSMIAPMPPPPPRPRQLPPPPPLPQPVPSVPSRPAPALPRPSYSGVSDRDSSQLSPITRQQSSTYHPLYTSRSISRYLKLPRTGLVNFSVTCYMNATIQCLIATIPISQFFLDNKWKDLTQKNWKGSNGIMPQIFANLVKALWADDGSSVRPTSLRNFCARLNREWGVDRQQDAKEFFDFIVDCLHEDLNINWQRTPLNPLTSKQELDRERLPIHEASRIEWDRYTHRESSYISERFAGQHASRLRCTTCHGTSTTYEAFYSISVEIPRTQAKRQWTIDDCLRSYCKEERLSGDEVWKCPYCKCEREATKQITITRAPQFMVVHFKRFEMRRGESAKKVHTPINFPLFGLNMEPYMVVPAPKKANPNHHQAMETWVDPATTPPYLYDAYAVMRHIGSSGNGGHYISLVRDAARGNIWRKFDDERVTDFDPQKLKPDQRLQNEQAYIVFYGRAAAR
ncbi:ubiquitin-specific protease doa4 [Lecanora helva]